jgi:hypothetical protein
MSNGLQGIKLTTFTSAGPEPQAGQADATKDPMLRDKVHGKHLLDVRKQLAFQGYTFVSVQRLQGLRNGQSDARNNTSCAEITSSKSV